MKETALTTEVAGPAYTLREDKCNAKYWWVIERADGSVCFRLPREEWWMAEQILHNLLHGLSGEAH